MIIIIIIKIAAPPGLLSHPPSPPATRWPKHILWLDLAALRGFYQGNIPVKITWTNKILCNLCILLSSSPSQVWPPWFTGNAPWRVADARRQCARQPSGPDRELQAELWGHDQTLARVSQNYYTLHIQYDCIYS